MAEKPASRACAAGLTTAEYRQSRRSGTALAIIDHLESCGLASGQNVTGLPTTAPATSTWGGARNRADRVNHHLTRRQCESLIAAAEFCQSLKRPFNRHWTVHYEAAGIPDSEGAAFVGRLLSRVRREVRRYRGNLGSLWVRENGSGKGAHVHILMHLPAGFSLRNKTRRWIEAAGGRYGKGVSKVRIIGGSLASASRGSERHWENVRKVLAYLLKGASVQAGVALGLARYGEGGKVIGKRCGRTQNIGKAARNGR